jgi:hypothetical protein
VAVTEDKPGNQIRYYDMLADLKSRLPECMAPDGAPPCIAFLRLDSEARQLREAVRMTLEWHNFQGDEHSPLPRLIVKRLRSAFNWPYSEDQ